jgi:hypothetical protein
MRARANLWIDLLIGGGYLIATNPVTTGTPVHEWLSVGVAVVGFVHVVVHWKWVVAVGKRVAGRLGPIPRFNLFADALLLATMVTVFVSGLAVSLSVMDWTGRVVSAASPWHAIHSAASTALLVLVGVHVGMHWSWVSKVARTLVQRVDSLSGREPSPDMRLRTLPPARLSRTALPARAKRAARATRSVLAAGAVVAVLAVSVWYVAPAQAVRLNWLVLPGGLVSVSSDGAASVEAPAAPRTEWRRIAAGFEGSPAERIAVRASHSLVVLGVAFALGIACHEFLRAD